MRYNPLPRGGLQLAALQEAPLLPGSKGLPLHAPLLPSQVAAQQWNILRGDTPFPVAVLKSSVLQHNLQWMEAFCRHYGVQLAPHGKTTMSPQLFDAQLAQGAWGMTLATLPQVQTAHRFGVRRVLLANQLVAPAELQLAARLLQADPDFELLLLVDSVAGVERLQHAAQSTGLQRGFSVLIELGFSGGRTGCRSAADALALARSVAAAPGVHLAGVEGYEGLLVSANREQDLAAVQHFLSELASVLQQIDHGPGFAGEQVIISAGGSAYFDRVAEGFANLPTLSRPLLPILRSGCYLTHDHGFYHGLIREMQQRLGASDTGLQPALEVWSMVQSRPEADLAILTMGKRDASYDIELPLPQQWHRPGSSDPLQALPAGSKVEKMNDQHAYLRLPEGTIRQDLQVGDLVMCGISHPCTTFDKWPHLLLVDDGYQVQDIIHTCF
ncbi:amino acid deaminase [Leeia aquatica]|uniref:Amino acid deaminase n=1 Tax=Leeia aquatica TaxID=2725557 RepID=A0A847SAP3_9NEIS|nr:amino acid deaminase [Leeia aquatica]NLR76803.1 amino acid deaminase [Leeia aquatica]